MSCLRKQRSDAGEARTRGPSVSSQALYQCATALPRTVWYFLYRFLILTVFPTFENALWLFLMVPWIGRWCVIVAFLDHTHLLIYICTQRRLPSAFELDKSYQSGLSQYMRTPAKLCVYCELPINFSWGNMCILAVVKGILSMCYQYIIATA